MKSIDENDATLTAYALGELSSEEAAAFEARLATDASLRRAVDEIKHTAQTLTAQFAAEPALGLTEAQRLRIQQRPEPAARTRMVFRTRTLWLAGGLAAAACLSLAFILTAYFRNSNSEDQVAVNLKNAPQSAATENQVSQSPRDKVQATDSVGQATGSADALQQSGKQWLAKEESAGGRLDDQEFRSSDGRKQPSPSAPQSPPVQPDLAGRAGGSIRAPVSETQPPAATAGVAVAGRGNAPGPGGAPPPAPASGGIAGGGGQLRRATDPTPANGATKPVHRDRMGRRQLERAEKDADAAPAADEPNREGLAFIAENPFIRAIDNPLSTFSIDVDTASYSNVRRFLLDEKRLPPPDAVRIEEMINYFNYSSYEAPTGDAPFSANVEVNAAPWNPEHRLLRIGLRGKDIKVDMRPPTSLVFLIDVSGSMQPANKLPLVKQSLRLLVDKLNGDDRLAIVTYAGQAGTLLDSMFVNQENKAKILQAVDSLTAGGSTNGAGGIKRAYEVATAGFIKDGANRVILCTDGDFNVGVSSDGELVRYIEEKRKSNVKLSVLGFGAGNFQDGKMEQLADKGDGNFAYIDSIDEAKKVLVDQMTGTLVTIAKDVKIQVDFNPGKVGAYRLIGYEDRMLAAADFRDDRKDAGDIGAGHTVTALYEIVPADKDVPAPDAPKSEFVDGGKLIPSDLLGRLKLSYKQPDGATSKELALPIGFGNAGLEQASSDFQFAAAVAAFGMVLRDSGHKGTSSFQSALDLAVQGLPGDKDGRRAEFIHLIETARAFAASDQ